MIPARWRYKMDNPIALINPGEMVENIFIEAMDVLNEYIKIAFADITNYVTFGQKDVEVMGPFGPVKDEDGKPVMRTISYVDFNESDIFL